MIGCRPLTDSEIDRLKTCTSLSMRDRCLLILGCTTGFRISELLTLRVQDVQGPRITVQRRAMKGKDRSRTVPLLPEAQAAIEAHIYESHLQPSDPLFKSTRQNRPISRIQAYRCLTAAFKELGLTGKVATHSMRKYYAAGMYHALGRDLLKTSKALGHRYINTTADYLSFDTQELDEAALTLRHRKP